MNYAGEIPIRMSLLLVAIAIVLPFPGCETETAPPVKLYDGAEKALSEIAVLKCPYWVTVDSHTGGGTLHILPGKHVVHLSKKESWKSKTFWAQAGHKYEVAPHSYTMITVRDESTAIWGIYDKTAKWWVVQ